MYQKPISYKLKGVKKGMYWKDTHKGINSAGCHEGLEEGQQHHEESHLPDITLILAPNFSSSANQLSPIQQVVYLPNTYFLGIHSMPDTTRYWE